MQIILWLAGHHKTRTEALEGWEPLLWGYLVKGQRAPSVFNDTENICVIFHPNYSLGSISSI